MLQKIKAIEAGHFTGMGRCTSEHPFNDHPRVVTLETLGLQFKKNAVLFKLISQFFLR